MSAASGVILWAWDRSLVCEHKTARTDAANVSSLARPATPRGRNLLAYNLSLLVCPSHMINQRSNIRTHSSGERLASWHRILFSATASKVIAHGMSQLPRAHPPHPELLALEWCWRPFYVTSKRVCPSA